MENAFFIFTGQKFPAAQFFIRTAFWSKTERFWTKLHLYGSEESSRRSFTCRSIFLRTIFHSHSFPSNKSMKKSHFLNIRKPFGKACRWFSCRSIFLWPIFLWTIFQSLNFPSMHCFSKNFLENSLLEK